MKLVRVGIPGDEKPGILDSDGEVRDLSGVIPDLSGTVLTEPGLRRLREIDPHSLPRVEAPLRYGPPVGGIGKVICVGLNYADHCAEAGMPLPQQPVLFMKATTAICGPNDSVILPRGSVKTDWEVELGVVIGDIARDIRPDQAKAHIAGYVIVNDISEREFQLDQGGQWFKGKSCDTFAPIGPWLVTADEIDNTSNLEMWLTVNGQRFQDGSTATMIFGVEALISYISRYVTLMPGDVISTGTPPGVGLGLKPPRYLRAGDVMELGINGLGTQRQLVLPPADIAS